MEVREVRVSSVLEFSLHCSISSSILLTVLCMVSFTFRSPKDVPCVFQVSNRLSHALVVSSILSRKKSTPASVWPRRKVIWFRILFRLMVYLSPSLDIVMPASGSIPKSLCFRASIISNEPRT